MSKNWSKELPTDRMGQTLTNSPPPYLSNATTHRENASISSVTSLGSNTTVVEVTAVGIGAGIRWAANQATSVITAAGTANFDVFVPTAQSRLLVIPKQTQGAGGSVVGLNTLEGLYGGIATKSAGVGSVLLTEY